MKEIKKTNLFSLIPERAHPVCLCNNVSEKEIVNAIHNGAINLEKIKKSTKAASSCGTCESKVIRILNRELKKIDTL